MKTEIIETEVFSIGVFNYLEDTIDIEEELNNNYTQAKNNLNDIIRNKIILEFRTEALEENLFILRETFDFSDNVILSQPLCKNKLLIFEKSEFTLDIYLKKNTGYFLKTEELTHLYKFFISKHFILGDCNITQLNDDVIQDNIFLTGS